MNWLASCCCHKTMTQTKMGKEKVYVTYGLQSITEESREGTQGKHLEAGTEAEAMEEDG